MGQPNVARVPHKHAELIKAWADGAEIQVKFKHIWHDANMDLNWNLDAEYRIKPKTIRYRNYLANDGVGCPLSILVAYSDNAALGCRFVRWLGDWQEVEI